MEEKITCRICEHEANNSLQAHLKFSHKMTPSQYKEMYGSPIYSIAYGEKIKLSNSKRDPSYRKKLSDKIKENWADPQKRLQYTESLKKAQNSEEAKNNHRKGAIEYYSQRTDEDITLQKEVIKRSWADPEKRENRVKAMRAAGKSGDSSLKRSEAIKKYFCSLSERQKEDRRQKLKNVWSMPGMREKILKIAKNASICALTPQAIINRNLANQKPEVREKRRQNALKRLAAQPIISSLNILFGKALNESDLFPLPEQTVGYYSVDFLFPEQKIVVEVDGDYWHGNPLIYTEFDDIQKKTMSKDLREGTYLRNSGYVLLRFWEKDINKDIFSCINKVKEALNAHKR